MDKNTIVVCIFIFIYLICTSELIRLCPELWLRLRTWYVRWNVLRKTRLKTVDVDKATEKDIKELGRVVGPYVSNDHKESKPYLIKEDEQTGAFKTVVEENSYVSRSSTMKTLRNKKTGVVIICSWDLVKIQDTYGKDWEIVEAAIKE